MVVFGIDGDRDRDRDRECFRVREIWVKNDERKKIERKERGGRGLIIFLFTIFLLIPPFPRPPIQTQKLNPRPVFLFLLWVDHTHARKPNSAIPLSKPNPTMILSVSDSTLDSFFGFPLVFIRPPSSSTRSCCMHMHMPRVCAQVKEGAQVNEGAHPSTGLR